MSGQKRRREDSGDGAADLELEASLCSKLEAEKAARQQVAREREACAAGPVWLQRMSMLGRRRRPWRALDLMPPDRADLGLIHGRPQRLLAALVLRPRGHDLRIGGFGDKVHVLSTWHECHLRTGHLDNCLRRRLTFLLPLAAVLPGRVLLLARNH